MNGSAAPSLGLQESFTSRHLRDRLHASIDLPRLYSTIDNDPELTGAAVAYIDRSMNITILREFTPVCRHRPIKVVLREPPRRMSVQRYASELATERESQAVMRVLSTTLTCGTAVLAWLIVAGSSTAIPLTGGTSLPLTLISKSAAAASSMQCLISGGRTLVEFVEPSWNNYLDSQGWFRAMEASLNAISIAGVISAGATTLRLVNTYRAQGLGIQEALGRLNRVQRKRLTLEIIRLNHPAASGQLVKQLQRGGLYPTRYSAHQIRQTTLQRIGDIVSASLTITERGMFGQNASIAIGVYEESSW